MPYRDRGYKGMPIDLGVTAIDPLHIEVLDIGVTIM